LRANVHPLESTELGLEREINSSGIIAGKRNPKPLK